MKRYYRAGQDCLVFGGDKNQLSAARRAQSLNDNIYLLIVNGVSDF
jgi:hypothetical protein